VRSFILAVALFSSSALAGVGPAPQRTAADYLRPRQLTDIERALQRAQDGGNAQSCCKVCKRGQACGDSCISWDKTCSKPPGCACQG
jgi:hypothetical protein